MRELTPELLPQPIGMISLSGAGLFDNLEISEPEAVPQDLESSAES